MHTSQMCAVIILPNSNCTAMARRNKRLKKSLLIDPLTGWEDESFPLHSFHYFPQMHLSPLLPLKSKRVSKLLLPLPLSPVTLVNVGQPMGSPLRSKLRMGIHRNALLSAAATLADCREQVNALRKRFSKARSLLSSQWSHSLPQLKERSRR